MGKRMGKDGEEWRWEGEGGMGEGWGGDGKEHVLTIKGPYMELYRRFIKVP